MNYALCRGVVGGRMEVLGGHLRSATSSITAATSTGDWSEAVFERIAVDSNDQIGEAGRAFNSLLGAVEGRKELEERLRFQAFHDQLTGLPNRAYMMDKFVEAEALREEGTPSAVLFLDVDNLKAVNDNLGHEGGDTLIKLLAERMIKAVRDTDTVARLSGDEFAILLVGSGSEHQADRVAHRLINSLRAPTQIDEHLVRTGFSIGLATSKTCAASGIGMLRAADMAMYAAKAVRQFQHPDLVGDVADALQRSGLDPSLLTLEITESLFAQDIEETTRKIGLLKDKGCRLAL
ncbi:MAG: diguanylate cyclase, partial [Actinomycetota bacterium]|nr:diguanylate cyclase [Actinomycetota bacterium]